MKGYDESAEEKNLGQFLYQLDPNTRKVAWKLEKNLGQFLYQLDPKTRKVAWKLEKNLGQFLYQLDPKLEKKLKIIKRESDVVFNETFVNNIYILAAWVDCPLSAQ